MGERFVFVGNRRFVLQSMLDKGVRPSSVYVVAGTHLERDILRGDLKGVSDYVPMHNKEAFLNQLAEASFDVLVSNGCPYILPVDNLPPAQYINVHPSFLPDLKGVDPVIGAILFRRDAGATCHIMDSGVDTGPIIAQVRIPFTDDLDVSTLYQMSFVAEQQAFLLAWERGFEPQSEQIYDANAVNFTRSPSDQVITFVEDNETLMQKIKAFNNRSQGCRFYVMGQQYRAFSAQRIQNPFMLSLLNDFADCVVGLSYERSIVFRKDGEVLRIMDIESPNQGPIAVGTSLLGTRSKGSSLSEVDPGEDLE